MILDYYKKLLNEHKNLDSQDKIKLTQNQALQLIFDLKFLHTLFDLKSTGVYLNVGSSEHLELNKLYQNTKFGQANFNLIINDMQDLIYAQNLLDIHNNLIRPFLNENKDKLEIVPDEYKRFYFFRNPLVLPQFGKSLTNLDSASSSDPHQPLNDFVESQF